LFNAIIIWSNAVIEYHGNHDLYMAFFFNFND